MKCSTNIFACPRDNITRKFSFKIVEYLFYNIMKNLNNVYKKNFFHTLFFMEFIFNTFSVMEFDFEFIDEYFRTVILERIRF